MNTSAVRVAPAVGAIEAEEGTFLGHPRGLFVLFFAEMWERFSFYGMRGLLIFYLTKHFLFGDAEATAIYSCYGSLVYLTPMIGGIVADRWLGFRRAVAFGAMLLTLGHFGMAFEGDAAVQSGGQVLRDAGSLQIFYLALALIIVGSGLLKPNISNMVGRLYGKEDPRRDSGFTIFYMGINIGAATSGLFCGWLGETFGWRYGFGAAGVGMLLGLVTFLNWKDWYAGTGEPPSQEKLDERIGPLSLERWIYLACVGAVGVAWQLMQNRAGVGALLALMGGGVVAWIMWFSFARCERVERDRMIAVLLLTSIAMIFWVFFEQAGSSLNLFADRNVDRQLLGATLTAAQFQAVNPSFIILLAALFAWLWVKLTDRGLNPSTPMKFGLALVQLGLGFGALVFAISRSQNGYVGAWWLVLAYLLHTTGELCQSPVGLSMVTRLSVARVSGLMMGVWFLFTGGFAQFLAGVVAGEASIESSGEATSAVASLPIYGNVFWLVTELAVGAGLVVMLFAPLLKRLMHEDE